LRIGYSDWPGWVAWQVAIEQGFFERLGVDVRFTWLEYVPSIEAFSEGQVDAVCMTNGDALVAGSSGAPSVGIVINDYSNGNDMVVARSGITRVSDLRGKRIGVEIGFVDHLLLMEALTSAQLRESDVSIVNAKTHETPELLAAGGVDAIAAWQPHSGRALDLVKDSRAVFTSADVPGLIYDMLFVARGSLEARRDDWIKVVKAWFMVVDYIADPSHEAEALAIMARRVSLPAPRYAKLMSGTRLLGGEENRRRFRPTSGLESVAGSSQTVDRFNLRNHVYRDAVAVAPYFDSSLVEEALAEPHVRAPR
jgi:NitT/TauT family transport system substrate-binding protein